MYNIDAQVPSDRYGITTSEGYRVKLPKKRNAYQHVIFKGKAGEQVVDIINEIPLSEYSGQSLSRLHENHEWSEGLSRKTLKQGGILNYLNYITSDINQN